jgi:4-amino-4-deoxy-L-arabinose transferase-like glycosyltransferase
MTKKIFLILIILLAFLLRFYKLDVYPAVNADEASNGYDAYSLIKTGMDQHGRSWPLTFQSFNDFKPGLHVYLTVPFVAVLGLNEWSVRIPGALLGVLSVWILYLLVKELFKNERFAVLSAFLLAISPWHIQFSRGGWEVNTATFLLMTGLLFLFRGLNTVNNFKRARSLIWSSLFLVASLYSYHSVRIIVPLLGLAVLALYGKRIFRNFKPYLTFGIVSLALLIPLVFDLLSPGALSRVAGVGLFADKGPINRINEQRGEHDKVVAGFGKLFHNKAVNYGLAFVGNWATHYQGEFLFMSGDLIERNKVPETGEMYLFDILFLAVGLVAVAKIVFRDPTGGNAGSAWKFVTAWLLMAPVASALTFQSPNALRSQNMVIPLTIVSAYGLYTIGEWLSARKVNKRMRDISYFLIITVIVWCFARYQHMYWDHMSKVYPYSSQYGVRELVSYVSGREAEYKDIIVTTRYDQPYILFLFYMHYPPSEFQGGHTLSSRDEFGFSTVAGFGKYHFESIDFDSAKKNYPNSLIIGTSSEIPDAVNVVERIYGTNGFEYFKVVRN